MEISFKNIEHIVYGSDRRKETERFTSTQRWFIFAGSPVAQCAAFFKPFILCNGVANVMCRYRLYSSLQSLLSFYLS